MIVSPAELADLERLVLSPDRRVAGVMSGNHRAAGRGRSLDVVDWREYQPGDDPRLIDVQAWARLDQVLVREFEPDVDLSVQLIVDTSASMGFGGSLRQAGRITAAVAVGALVRNETISLSTFARPAPRRFRGRAAIGELLATVESWRADGTSPLHDHARRLVSSTRRSGLIVVVSDFLTPEAAAAMDVLASRREQVVGLAVTSDELADTMGEVRLVDAETGVRVDVDLSPRVLDEHREQRARSVTALRARLARHGGQLIEVSADADLIGDVVPRLVAHGVLR